ncbi:hypothetical protein PN483_01725 [Nodularia spumigena CS-591/04]|uniref:NACHT domain-containing protein n=1 Tax=Nodularia spumigena TaxID=70799 RepID=UPI002330BEB0|nr:hypothetical protein [Nodularia spumigena]MDB9322537.1 hypothetical protein [Nodularia spumigena CS-591/07A]MDB9329235.1 hypothetical protein [Nodularia spumigena CS-591/04]
MLIKEYIFANLNYISHPFNKSGGTDFPDLQDIGRLFENFINLPSYQQLGRQIATAIEDHQNLPYSDITRRILNLKNLVLTVEPFMRAVGGLRYANNPELLARVETQKLRLLLEHGLILGKMSWDENYSNQKHCSNYWSQQDCYAAVAYQVYLLRNELSHETVNYSVEKISVIFNITLALLLLVIRHTPNRLVIELATSPYRSYIEWLSKNLDKEYEKYVPLQAYLKWEPSSLDDQILVPMHTLSRNHLPEEVDEISTLIKQVDKMILAGEGGAGKSRTLKHTAVTIAREILSLKLTPQQIPIYFPADLLSNKDQILNLFSRLLPSIDSSEIQNSLNLGHYWLFIDGLNEVAPQRYLETIQELKSFLINYPRCRIIITTRQESYNNELPLPVYELQKLTPYGVKRILILNSTTEEQGCQLFNSLKKDKRLLALFKTPLMSKLLCELPKTIYIPRSIGGMMNIIFTQIFEREERKGDRASRSIKNMVLIELAKKIRDGIGTAISEEKVLQTFRDITREFSHDTSPNLLLLKLVESGVLDRRNDDSISFFHETALDYFFALGLKNKWDDDFSEKVCQEIVASTNTTVIEIMAGLVSNFDRLVKYIVQKDLTLAAKCYSARSNRANKIFNELLKKAYALLSTHSVEDECLAVKTMAALDEIEATQAVFKALPQLSVKARTAASHTLIAYAPSGVTEAVQDALEFGEFAKKLVAIQFVSAHQLVEVAQTLIKLADQHQANLANDLAKAIGRLETPETLNYLENQLEVPIKERIFPLCIAISATVSDASAMFLKKAIFDADTSVRQVAISRVEAIGIPDLDPEIAKLVRTDSDFLVRLIGAQILLSRAIEAERVDITKAMFSASIPNSYSLPATRIITVLSLLRLNEIEEVILQVLCQENTRLQSLIVNKLLSREPKLALAFVELIDFHDSKVPSGVKAALIRGLIQTNTISSELLHIGISPLAPIGVRLMIAQSLIYLPNSSFETTIETMLKDSVNDVKAEVFKVLLNSTKIISNSILFPFLTDSNQIVRKWAWRLVNKKRLFESEVFLDLTKKRFSNYVRKRAIQELCERGFQWSLNQVCAFVRESDYGIQWHGQNILMVILSSSAEYPGKILNYKVQTQQGILAQLGTRKKVFFRRSNVNDEYYIPRFGDIVAFKFAKDNSDKEYAENIRFLG